MAWFALLLCLCGLLFEKTGYLKTRSKTSTAEASWVLPSCTAKKENMFGSQIAIVSRRKTLIFGTSIGPSLQASFPLMASI